MSLNIEFQQCYYKEIVLKKEKSWIQYYATLYTNTMLFSNIETSKPRKGKSKDNNDSNNKLNFIEINSNTRCFHDTSKNRFPFVVQTGKISTKLKCETNLQRYKWLFAIRLCANGKPPQAIPNFIETKDATRRRRTQSARDRENIPMKSQRLKTQSTKETENTLTNNQRSRSQTVREANNSTTRPRIITVINESHEENDSKLKITNAKLSSSADDNVNLNRTVTFKTNINAINRPQVRRRSHSNIVEEEKMKVNKKRVKWDMRNAIRSYVNKNSELKRSEIEEHDKTSKNEMHSESNKFSNDKYWPKENTPKNLFKIRQKCIGSNEKEHNENNLNNTNTRALSLRSSFSKTRHLKTHSEGQVIDMRLDNIPHVENLSKIPKEDDELNSSFSTTLSVSAKNESEKVSFNKDSYKKHSQDDILNYYSEKRKHLASLFSINAIQGNNALKNKPGLSKTKSLNNLLSQKLYSIPKRVDTPPKRGNSAPIIRLFKNKRIEPRSP